MTETSSSERSGPRMNKAGRVSTTFWLTPDVLKRFKHRLLDLNMELGEGGDEAIRQFLEAPHISYKVQTPTEQRLVDGVLDMYRNPRSKTEEAMVQWMMAAITNR